MIANFWHIYGTQLMVAVATVYLRYLTKTSHKNTRQTIGSLISQIAKLIMGNGTEMADTTPKSVVTPGGPLINPGAVTPVTPEQGANHDDK